MLVRLVYASKPASAPSPETVESILTKSHERNPAVGVTGILCYTNDLFLQVLEGGRSTVSSLYNRICRDGRHIDVQLLYFREISERRFAQWSMGRVNLAKVNVATLLRYSERPTLDPFQLTGDASIALLEELIATASVVPR